MAQLGSNLYTQWLAGCWATQLWSSLLPIFQWAAYRKFSWKGVKFKRNSRDERGLLNAYSNLSYWTLAVVHIQTLAFSPTTASVPTRDCYLGVSLDLLISLSTPFGGITLCSYTCLYCEFQPHATFTSDQTNVVCLTVVWDSWDSKKISLSLYIRWFCYLGIELLSQLTWARTCKLTLLSTTQFSSNHYIGLPKIKEMKQSLPL